MEGMLKIDGYDEAVIGTVSRCGKDTLICYDYLKLIEITRDNSEPKMSYEEAMEYVDFNIAGAWMGEGTPAIMYPQTLEEIEENID